MYITVFTATYNRCDLLSNLFSSLCAQTEQNFEWLIVDDGSEDDSEKKVSEWNNESTHSFEIRYYKQQHGGKHRALNKGFRLARGKFFFIVDSDDILLNDSIQKVVQWCKEIENDLRFAGVSGLRMYPNGKIIGDIPRLKKKEFVDISAFKRMEYGLMGDKAEVYRTELLRKYTFPEYENEYFITENVCWDKIASDGYIFRWYNVPIYITEYLQDGLTKTGANLFEGHRKNYKGYCHYVSQCVRVEPFCLKMIHIREYDIFQRDNKMLWGNRAQDIGISKWRYLLYTVCGIPIGWIIRKIRALIFYS